ncbi:O-antigen ligase family protein [Mycetocola zhadangensis]|uniref:O-antigen ligase family protein n=1 Tax=Mycetocola zhadangensis TaxID=1164595 RepID=UPI003A4DC412
MIKTKDAPVVVDSEFLAPRPGLVSRLLFIAVVFLPFQQALTLEIGFPLKVTEIGIGLAFVATFFARKEPFAQTYGKSFSVVLAVLVGVSTAYSLVFLTPTHFDVDVYPRGLVVDVALYCGYGLFALLGWRLMSNRLGTDGIGRALMLAVRLTAVYCVVQLGAYFAGVALPGFLNGVTQIGNQYGSPLTRNGPFLEGNYLGFFSGVALFVALHRKDRLGIVLALSCALYSQSTSAMVAIVVGLIVAMLLRPTRAVVLSFVGAAILIAIVVFAIPELQLFIERSLGKLGFGEADVGNLDSSLRSRSALLAAGISVALAYPYFGTGPGRYALWFSDHADFSGGYAPPGIRQIVGNAYVQLAAEVGLIAGLTFGILVLTLVIRNRRIGPYPLGLSLFLVVALNAVPAWTVLTIWVAIAYATSLRPPEPDRGRRVSRKNLKKRHPLTLMQQQPQQQLE